MTTKTTSQTQQNKSPKADMGRKLGELFVEPLAHAERISDEIAYAQHKGLERTRGVVDEVANLTKASLDYQLKLADAWRTQQLEATRRMLGFFTHAE